MEREAEVAQQQIGFDAAVAVIEEKFFGGPTKNMVLGWLAEERRSLGQHEGDEQSS